MNSVKQGLLASANAFVVAAALAAAPMAAAAPTDAQKCESGKNGVVGKYAACLHKAQSKFVKGGAVDTAGYDEAVVKCNGKYAGKWQKLEDKAAGACPSTGDESAVQDFVDACVMSVEDALGGGVLPADVATCNTDLTTCRGDLGSCNGNLATCASDLSSTNSDLTTCTGDLSTTNADLVACEASVTCGDNVVDGDDQCDGGDLAGATCQSLGYTLGGLLGCTAGCAYDTSGCVTEHLPATGQTTSYGSGDDGDLQLGAMLAFVDNTDGTISDTNTGLMWEKKVALDGGTTDCSSEAGSCANPHDADNRYTWTAGSTAFDGTLVTIFLEQMNDRCSEDSAVACTVNADCSVPGGPCGFAGYRDWRVPNYKELGTILNLEESTPAVSDEFHGVSCAAACVDVTDPACSCTKSDFHFTSTTYADNDIHAWIIDMLNGYADLNLKTDYEYARAVRGGN